MTTKNTNKFKEKLDKLDEFYGLTIVYVALICLIGGMGIGNALARREKYVVTSKADNKIEYKSVRGGAAHVLDFSPVTDQGADAEYKKRLMYYDYINSGDTIRGAAELKYEPVPKAWARGTRGVYQTNVQRVNGHKLYEWIEMARRDSVIRNMKIREK